MSDAKSALYAMSEMMKHHDKWIELSRDYFFNRGYARRSALRCKTQGLVMHDRILHGRPL